MRITALTLFFSAISCVAIGRTLYNVKRDTVGFRSATAWIVLWAGIGFFSLFPSRLNAVMLIAQMENRTLFMLIVAVFILFALLFNLVSRVDKVHRNIGKLTQEIAILNYKLENLRRIPGKNER